MSGNFFVTSGNRHAVRKLLVASGLPATEVRMWPVSKLGAQLRERVHAGVIQNDKAVEACRNVTPDQEVEFEPAKNGSGPVEVPAPQPIPDDQRPVIATHAGDTSAQALATAIALAVQAAVSQVPTGTDETKVNALIAEAIRKAQLPRQTIVKIQTGDAVKAVEGRAHAALPDVLRIISSRVQGRRLHAWLVGPSGSGKSYLAKQAADALGLNFYSTGAIQSKYDLIGFVSPTGAEQTLRTPFRNAFEYGGVFSWDDCDASDPRAFVAFNEALSNGRFAFPDKCIEQHADFVAVASANTWGNGATADYVGRNKIDGATLSRFVRVLVDYDEELERDMVGPEHAEWSAFVQSIRKAVTACGVKVLVTPRATLQGAALLQAGMKRKDVEAMTVFAGVDKETEAKLRRAA